MSHSQPPSPSSHHAEPRHVVAATIVLLAGIGIGLTVSGHLTTMAKEVMGTFRVPVSVSSPDTTSSFVPSRLFTLRDLPTHPDAVHSEYFSPELYASAGATPTDRRGELHQDFQALLDLYHKRQRVDDNFTIRVARDDTHELLEVYVLKEDRRRYNNGADVEWPTIDAKRRVHTRRLVDKWEERGVPREEITVKWGRSNQIDEAHERDRPFLAYELRLTNYLGLSLLPTEIGTVETFNQDDLRSHVGARSRYQMMPFILRRSGVHQYSLRTEESSWVEVSEDLHPLLTMEPAFRLLRGYVNAVGHEIPGISAYHTGPGNIYKLYRKFFTQSGAFDTGSTVMDAYMWAITDGFETVSENSTFGPYSRGYVASAYGSLRAIDDRPIDLSNTVRAERVQLEPGETLMLADILRVLDGSTSALNWSMVADRPSTYERFRGLNPHLDLPETDDGELTPSANVRFVSSVDGKAVRFFLPTGGSKALEDAGITALDSRATFRFDDDTYRLPSDEQRTAWDRRYDSLVDDIKRFGFTKENRERLLTIYDAFERLAETNPTHYRQTQLDVIQTHRRIWLSNPWETLSDAATLATGKMRMRPQPPETLDTHPLDDYTRSLDSK
ncbi:hypothetical protein CRI94_12945 [Longibacter salinarum]|uniref:Transglycosylase SLT domain-containing protein n=1 Tax=Longibacter salinarum TaxID=1850348 RepID=A0A2A8CWD3_9BACT|nr:hypothetical protein [Longibacter salinarum]PEN12904.1 hypothetical protein CRI94_12945 [Longibacter salinarum]